MKTLHRLIQQEPIALLGATNAILVCASAFGLKLSGDQITGIVGVFNALAAPLLRTQATPNTNLPGVAPPAQG